MRWFKITSQYKYVITTFYNNKFQQLAKYENAISGIYAVKCMLMNNTKHNFLTQNILFSGSAYT